MFTTHFELGKLAILRQDGQFTVVRNPQSYLQVDGKPEELQYVHPTYKMREALAIERAADLRKQFPKINFTIKPYGNSPTSSVIWAQSPDKKSFAELRPYQFFAHESRRRKISYGRLLEWLIGMPFAQATYEHGTQIGETEYKGGVLTFNGRPATVDEIL